MTILIFTFYSYCLAKAFSHRISTTMDICMYIKYMCLHIDSCSHVSFLFCLLPVLLVMFAGSYAFGIFLFIALCFNRCCSIFHRPTVFSMDTASCQYGFHFACCALVPFVVDHFSRCLLRFRLQFLLFMDATPVNFNSRFI